MSRVQGSVRRVTGIEAEYGISVPADPRIEATHSSSQVVNAYASSVSARSRRTGWDYAQEDPLSDARGWRQSPATANPDQLTHEQPSPNVVLTNGARLYVDHAHPEYSGPEVTSPRDAVLWDKAGERVMARAAELAELVPGTSPILLYKNNTDNKGASYGTHENYLMDRQTEFADIVRHLTPFFVSRQVVTGAGRVGIGQDGRGEGFQISQRADFFETEVGLDTTKKRPIINTRDEPHATAEKYRRLHVIIGDANLAEVSTYLKVGTTSLVLGMIEDGWLSRVDLAIDSPVTTLRAVSHDPTLRQLVTLQNGRTLTAVQLQMEYLEQAIRWVEDRCGADADVETVSVLRRWESVLTKLERDPMLCQRELDWVAKLALLEGYRDKESLGWDAPKLHLVDLQYSDVRQGKGIYNRLVARGSMDRLLAEDEVTQAVGTPPTDTRAYFRGRCIDKYAVDVAAASWDSVIFDLPGSTSLTRIPTLEPLRGSKAHVGKLIDACDTASDLVRTLTGAPTKPTPPATPSRRTTHVRPGSRASRR